MKNAISKLALGTALAGTLFCAPVLASDLSGEISVWSWNIAAKSLQANVEGFNKLHPNVKVTVEDIGNQQVFDRMLAGCAAGGTGLPDVITVESKEAEIFWARFPDCAANLKDLGYTEEVASGFANFKRKELEVGDVAYAMPWDSGPVMMFYRRDMYEKAGVDPATIKTWDDFIAAGKKVNEANPGVTMTQANINGQAEFFEMIGQSSGCAYFSQDASSVTVSSPACSTALDIVKTMNDEGLLSAGNWGEKIQSTVGSKVATHMWGGWYEGTIRTKAEGQDGKWGMYRMPAVVEGGTRASNFGGSSLAIPSSSENKEAAYAFMAYALGTAEGQITMMREFGLVPSLLAALEDPFVKQEQPFWGGQKVWVDTLETLDEIKPASLTEFYGDAVGIMVAVQLDYLNGKYNSADAALAEAAKQISVSTGLPLAQ